MGHRRGERSDEGDDVHDDDVDVDLDDDSGGDGEESDQAYCPDCGALIWDQADICPKCFTYLAGHTSRFPPGASAARSAMRRGVVLLLVLALAIGGCAMAGVLLRRLFF